MIGAFFSFPLRITVLVDCLFVFSFLVPAATNDVFIDTYLISPYCTSNWKLYTMDITHLSYLPRSWFCHFWELKVVWRHHPPTSHKVLIPPTCYKHPANLRSNSLPFFVARSVSQWSTRLFRSRLNLLIMLSLLLYNADSSFSQQCSVVW